MNLAPILNSATKGYFLTGTGTEVGKTVVTAALARRYRAAGITCAAVKPVQSGARCDGAHCDAAQREGPQSEGHRSDGHRWVLPDAEVYRMAGQRPPEGIGEEFAYAFEPACSPHLAARMAGRTIFLERIVQFLEPFFARYDRVLVEGIGGAAVPLNERQTVLDLMQALSLPVLLVADNRLGVLNHAILALAAIRLAGLNVAGVVLTNTTPPTNEDQYLREDNRLAIEHYGRVPVVAEIGHIRGFNPQNAGHWRRLDACLGHLQ